MACRNIESYISYNGKSFWSFYSAYGMRTVQSELEHTLAEILEESVRIKSIYGIVPGSSAKTMPVYFETSSALPTEKITELCNLRLPNDIRVCFTRETVYEKNWPPKKHIKEYEYHFLNYPLPLVLPELCGCRIAYRLDLDAMRAAAYLLIGEYDFSSFTTEPANDPYRTIYDIDIDRNGSRIIVKMSGTGFLKNMVQMLTGELIRVGKGDVQPDDILKRIAMRTPDEKAPEMPASGLLLKRAYPLIGFEELIHNCNDFVDYYVVQRKLKSSGCVFVIIMRCQEREFDRLVCHIVRQTYLDEVEKVYILDKEGGRFTGQRDLGGYRPEYVPEVPYPDAMQEFDISGDWFLITR